MEDVTDHVFRDLIATLGAPDVYFTEFILADVVAGIDTDGYLEEAAARGNGTERIRRLPGRLRRGSSDSPLVAQIWGTKPETYRLAAQKLGALGFDGIDINMGCPIRKIRKHGACSQLIANPTLAAELIAAAKEGAAAASPPAGGEEHSDLPVSVKTRIGLDGPVTEQWCGFLLEQGIDLLTVHGRTADEMSENRARWEEVRRVVDLRDAGGYPTLIVGNGDVRHPGEFSAKARRYRVDGVMVGRGVFEDPFIFAGSGSLRRFRRRSREEKLNLLLHHIRAFRSAWEGERSYEVLKKFYKVYLTGFEGAETLRSQLNETHDFETAETILKRQREAPGIDASPAGSSTPLFGEP